MRDRLTLRALGGASKQQCSTADAIDSWRCSDSREAQAEPFAAEHHPILEQMATLVGALAAEAAG